MLIRQRFSLIAGVVLAVISTSNSASTTRRPLPIPADWRSRIADDSYHYNLQKGDEVSLFEGDIKGVDRVTEHPSDQHHDAYLSRNAIMDKSMRWKDGIVPYEISPSFTAEQRQMIEDGLRDMMAKTCVRFVAHRSEPDYVFFVNRRMGCSSYVSRVGGQQLIDLTQGCLTYIGETQHEVMHALGFYHEQSRSDRDTYVQIVWGNLIKDSEDQFKTYRTDNLDMPYDYGSIMHYGWNYFAKDKTLPTIIPLVQSGVKVELGTRKVMSAIDVEKINRLYECPQRTGTGGVGVASGTTQAPRATTRFTQRTQPRVTPRPTTTTTIGRRLPPNVPTWNRPPGTPPPWNSAS